MKKLVKFFCLTICIFLALSLFACKPENSNSASNSSLDTSLSSSTGNAQESGSSVNSQNVSSSEQSSTKSSSGTQSSNSTPSTSNLTYAQKVDAYLDGAQINDQSFINYYKSLGEYNDSTVQNNAIYASPEGNGNGSISSPYSLQEALDSVSAGQTLYLRGGTYNASSYEGFFINSKGNASNYVTIRNYPGEKPVITNTHTGNESYGFQIDPNTCYTIIEGLEIANVSAKSAYGLVMWGNNQNHIIIRNNDIHDIKTTSKNFTNDYDACANAILLFGEGTKPISNVIISQNYCHDVVNGWAETLSVTANCEYVYVLDNKVKNNTNIGIDFYGNAEGYCSNPALNQPRYSIASHNEISSIFCSYSDCAGLYVDGARDIILQYNTIYDCQFGIEVGSEERNDSYPVKNITVRNNLIKDNTVVGIRVGGYEMSDTGVVYSTTFINNTLINNTKSNTSDCAEIIIAKTDGIAFVNNLIYSNTNPVLIRTDFSNSYCKNLTFNSNFFKTSANADSFKFEMYQSNQNGLSAFCTLTGATSVTGDIAFENEICPTQNSFVINAGSDNSLCGNYDYQLNARKNGKIDIGAIERQ